MYFIYIVFSFKFDSYLYVIDPRSSDPTPYGDYDDDEADTGDDVLVKIHKNG